MLRSLILLMLGVCTIISQPTAATAAEKVDLSAQMTAAKATIEEIAAKVGNYPQALTEIEKARASQKKAEQAYDKGKQWMGLRGITAEAEQEVRHHLLMVEMATTLATTRAAKGRNDEEAAAVDKQLAVVKARVKLLEDRKAEDERLRQTAQKFEASSKELASLKSDNAKLATQLEQLTTDKKKLEAQIEALTVEKTTLANQLDTLKKAAATPAPAPQQPAQPAPAAK